MSDQTLEQVTFLNTYPGLIARDYYDPDVWARERDTVFANGWFCIGRAEEIPNAGDYLARDIAGEGVLAVRGKDDRIRVFYNVCRHRGSVLCEDERGNAKGAIVCPYHNWAYDLEGNLAGTPNVREDEEFDRAAYPLRTLVSQVWEGYLFASQNPSPTPLIDFLATQPDGPLDYARFGLGELRVGHRITYEVEANWKIIHDNYNECLHCPGIHPELTALVPMFRKGMVVDLDRRDYGATLDEGFTTFTMTGTSDLPRLPGTTDLDCRTYWGYSIFPNVLMNLVSTGAMSYTLYPRGPSHTTVVSEYLFRPETIAEPGFDCSDMVEFLDLVSVQDWAVCERAQRGVASKGFVQGVYPPADAILHRFANEYLAARGPMPGDPA
jgi:Rieske 2Fe-2S family protein